MPIPKKLLLTWLGHSTFKLTTPEGKIVLIDPWVDGNPACPAEAKNFDRLDLMLITHGHSDHMGDALALAKKYQPHIISIFEISLWLEGKGVGNLHPMGKGGTQTLEGITVTMTQAHHSSSILDEGKMVYAGEPAGYIIQFSTGYRMYHAGDTALFGDMKLIGELYRPKLALLPIGDLFTMGPQEAAHAAKLLRVREVVPMHFGTFPLLTGTVEAFKQEVRRVAKAKVIDLKPGKPQS